MERKQEKNKRAMKIMYIKQNKAKAVEALQEIMSEDEIHDYVMRILDKNGAYEKATEEVLEYEVENIEDKDDDMVDELYDDVVAIAEKDEKRVSN